MRLIKYLLQYRIRDMVELLANDKIPPKECNSNLKGKLVVISGATSGIGLETARLYASRGAKLICLNRNPDKSSKLEESIREEYQTEISTILVDFSSLKDIYRCAKKLLELNDPIDIFIHNAGIYNTKRTFTNDNIEEVFQVNHLSSFLLNYLLREKFLQENRARIIYVNSEGHRFALAGVHLNDLRWGWHLYSGLKSYGAAKTAQLLTMEKFREFFQDTRVTINAMHPGNVKSNIGSNNGSLYKLIKRKLVLSSAKESNLSAKALLFLGSSKEVGGITGKFFNLTTLEKPAPHGRDFTQSEKVWNTSLELCGLIHD